MTQIELEEKPVYQSPYLTRKALAHDVLAVAHPRGRQGWAVYVSAVPGRNHDHEVEDVLKHGCKQSREIACVLFPQFDPKRYCE